MLLKDIEIIEKEQIENHMKESQNRNENSGPENTETKRKSYSTQTFITA